MADPVVIVGAGQAGVQLCLSLRKSRYDGPIIMYSAEPELPYHRPPLSKGYLLGKADEDKLPMRPETFYASKSVDLRLGSAVTSIDLATKTVTSDAGSQSYSHLVFATGASARRLPIDGADLHGVHCLRSLAHSRAIKADLQQTDNVVVIGAGFIGLEVAAAARSLGKTVTVFDTADRVMARAVAPDISRWFEQMHADNGIEIRLSEAIQGIGGADGRVSHVTCASGEQLSAQMVVIGIGVTPDTAIAEAAGLACEDGVVVDEYCRSSDPFVYAAGDCASHPNRYASRDRIRLESIQNATDQARVIAVNIAAAPDVATDHPPELTAYTAVPWFWSDQGDHSLQMTGLSFDADQFVVRGDPVSGSFSVYHFKADGLLAVDSVNMPRDHMLARKLIEAGVSPSAAQAADPDCDLKALLPGK